MKGSKNEIYALIDEDFLSKFSDNHLQFMKDFYYKFYCKFCSHYRRKPLSHFDFYSNMHRRRIQMYQLCCPYCGAIHIMPYDKRLHGTAAPNYCPNCGKASTIDNIKRQISRFIRINGINRLGLKELKAEHPDVEEWILAYDCYQMEIIELASIVEVVFRDYFEALLFINNSGESRNYTSYVKRIIDRHNGNDFMNIEKAHVIFKKAFEINLKECINKNIWNDLIDIVNLRNMMVHNNGRVDERFKTTPTYTRLKSRVEDKLFRLEDADIANYLKSVILAVTDITNIYLEKYYLHRNAAIANYYFNHVEVSSFEEPEDQNARH